MDRHQLRPDDEVFITGNATSPVRRFEDLHAVVATIDREGFVKVWPVATDGKVWFPFDQIDSVRLVGAGRGCPDATDGPLFASGGTG